MRAFKGRLILGIAGLTILSLVAPTLVLGEGFPAGMETEQQPRRSTQIKYINPEVPDVRLPGYEGKRYSASVPDTLDLAERARLAVNGLTGPTDPNADYELYWTLLLGNNPPYMYHAFSDHVQIKFYEALPLVRLASGSRQNLHVEQRLMEVLVQMQGPDGLLYYPRVGRPWAEKEFPDTPFTAMPDGDHYTEPYANGRLLGALGIYYQLTGDESWKEMGTKMVDGLIRQAIHRDDYAYFTKGSFGVNEVSDPGLDQKSIDPGANMSFGWITMGLAQFYRSTGYEPALDLSGKLARYTRYHGGMFEADGHFTGIAMHFHGHLYPMLGMLEYGIAAGGWEMIQFVKKGYEFGTANMEPLLGYVAEVINPETYNTSEMCGVADMIAMGLKLIEAGAGDYWDDVDRWTRNHFAEGQLARSDWVEEMIKDKPVKTPLKTEYFPHFFEPGDYTTENVGERSVGGFAGWPSVNDWQGHETRSIAHCCTGNGTRAIYYVWENILHHQNGRLKVNLLLNRASPWADVNSHIPYQGRVDVKVKQARELSIRIPEWAKAKDARCQVNGKERSLSWQARYAVVGRVRSGDEVTLTFPIAERIDRVQVEGHEYTLVRKGNDVISVDPPGKNHPLYERDHYRENQTRLRSVERFVADRTVDW